MDFKQKFYDITHLVQQEFDRNAAKYGEKLQCRKGCSGCCSQIFRITLLDAYIIEQHVKTLPPERQAQLRSKAEEYLKQVPHLQQSDAEENLSVDSGGTKRKSGIPCPALGEEGECTIYEARPIVCRRFGIPLYDYKNPGNVYACELNFKSGEEIIDDELIPNQTAIGMKWDELKDDFNENDASKKGSTSTTIAEAILRL
jgi:Fe-S-cluster containining protein